MEVTHGEVGRESLTLLTVDRSDWLKSRGRLVPQRKVGILRPVRVWKGSSCSRNDRARYSRSPLMATYFYSRQCSRLSERAYWSNPVGEDFCKDCWGASSRGAQRQQDQPNKRSSFFFSGDGVTSATSGTTHKDQIDWTATA